MPFFWESSKWKKRLDALKIRHPRPSGHFVDSIFRGQDSFVDLVNHKISYLKQVCQEVQDSRFKSLTEPLSKMMTVYDSNLKKIKKNSNPDFYIRRLYDILNVSPGDSILEYLIYKPGVARVRMNDELYELRGYMEDFLHKLSDMMANQDSRFEFIPNQIGSMAEETRAGFGDEYDYRLDMKMDSKTVKNLFNDFDFDISKVYQEVNCGSMKFLLEFYPTLKSSLDPLVHVESQSPFNFVGYDFNSMGVMYLCFEWKTGNPDKDMLVKVDCVPAIVLRDFWPSHNHSDPLGNAIKPLSHIILKLNTKSQWIHPAWSLSNGEVEFMASLPNHIKDGYTLCKNFIALVFGNIDKLENCLFGSQSIRLPSSYHLKTSLFNCIHTGKIKVNDQLADDYSMNVLDIAYNILKNESTSKFKAFFLSEREHVIDFPKPYGINALKILTDLQNQHQSRNVPKQCKQSADNKKLSVFLDILSPSSVIFNESLEHLRGGEDVDYEVDRHLEEASTKILQTSLKRKADIFSQLSSLINKGSTSRDKDYESDISLD